MTQLLPYIEYCIDLVLKEMQKQGHPMKVASTYRSFIEQEALYAKGRTRPGSIVTNARGGESWHNYKVAADLCFVNGDPFGENQPWDLYGKVAKQFGFEWGGEWQKFKDRPHIQMTFGQSEFALKKLGETAAIAKLTSLSPQFSSVSLWAEDSFKKAEKKGFSRKDPEVPVDPVRLRHILVKAGFKITDGDTPLTYQEMIVALDRDGKFN